MSMVPSDEFSRLIILFLVARKRGLQRVDESQIMGRLCGGAGWSKGETVEVVDFAREEAVAKIGSSGLEIWLQK